MSSTGRSLPRLGLAAVAGIGLLVLAAGRPAPAAAVAPLPGYYLHDHGHQRVDIPKVGDTVHPEVHVPGIDGAPPATGTLNLKVYNGATCAGPVLKSVSNLPVVNGVADAPMLELALLYAGVVCVDIDYSGDAAHSAYHGMDPHTVAKGNIGGLTLNVHDRAHTAADTWPVGTYLHPSVEVSALGAPAAGSVEMAYFVNGDCSSTPVEPATSTVSGGVAHVTAWERRPSAPGANAYRVRYLGDANYNASLAACFPFTVVRAKPTILTRVHDATHAVVTQVPIGTAVHPYIELNGPYGGIAGNVTVFIYPSSNCTGTPAQRTAPTIEGIVDGSVSDKHSTVENKSYRTSYAGNALFEPVTGTCDRIDWRVPSTTSAVAHNSSHGSGGSIVLPDKAHMAVNVDGSGVAVTGTVKVRAYRGLDCTGGQIASIALTLTGGAADGGDLPLNSPGEYSSDVLYTGSATHLPSVSLCRNITVRAVSTATLTAVIAQGAVSSVPVGVDFAWRVIVTGGYKSPSGHAYVYEYPSDDCSGTAHIYGTPIVGGAGTTLTRRLLDVTTVSARAVYASDNFYLGDDTPCIQLPIVRAKPGVAAPVHDSGHRPVTGVTAGGSVHPTLTSTGTAGLLGGEVAFSFYANGTCSGTPAAESAAFTVSGGAADATGFAQVLGIGQYSFRGHYLGDERYEPRDTNCSVVVGLEPGDTPPPPTDAPPPPTAAPTIAVTTPAPGTSYPPIDGLPSEAPSAAPSGAPASADPLASAGATAGGSAAAGASASPEAAGSVGAVGPVAGATDGAGVSPTAGTGAGVPPLAFGAIVLLALLAGGGAFLLARRSGNRRPA